MPHDTSAGNSLPSGSHPSAQPEPAARFQSYAEYLARLNRSPFLLPDQLLPGQSRKERLWLASFTDDGRYIERYSCIIRYSRRSKNLPAVDDEGIRPGTTVVTCSDFRTLLQTTEENVAYRIIIAATDSGVPSPTIEDILGLGLDLEPDIFDYVKSTLMLSRYVRQNDFPLPWFKDALALRIGSDVLCILEKTPERRCKTGTREYTPSTIRLTNHVCSDHIFERQ